MVKMLLRMTVVMAFACINFSCVFSQNILTVNDEGKFFRYDRDINGIGVNYFDLFYRKLQNHDDTTYKDGLRKLKEYNIPFARIMACGFWPIENELYFTDKEAYFSLMDEVVEEAENNNIGLILCMFWTNFTLPDLMGEHLNRWGDTTSQTIAAMRVYTSEIVQRYKDVPVIWGWEFGNEYNLGCNLPNAADWRPPVYPELGTPEFRTEEDDMYRDYTDVLFTDYARTVRLYDTVRPIFTGHSIPRFCAWHNTYENNWDKDTRVQFEHILLRDNPDDINTIDIHLYKNNEEENYFEGEDTDLNELVQAVKDISDEYKKPLYIGEFGEEYTDSTADEQHAMIDKFIGAILSAQVQMSSVWVYDRTGIQDNYNITAYNVNSWILDELKEVNDSIGSPVMILNINDIQVNDNDTIDIGNIQAGSFVDTSVTIRNMGNKTLILNTPVLSDPCAEFIDEYDTVVLPGESVNWLLRINAPCENQDISTDISIISNDTIYSPLSLNIKASVINMPVTELLQIPCSGSGNSDGTAWVIVTGGVMPYTYLWSNMSDNDTISGLSIGIYTVTVTDQQGCSVYDSVEVTYTTEIEDKANHDIIIYPNPSNKMVYVRGKNIETVRIAGSDGRILKNMSFPVPYNDYLEIDLTGFLMAKGIYIVNIITTEGVSNFLLVWEGGK